MNIESIWISKAKNHKEKSKLCLEHLAIMCEKYYNYDAKEAEIRKNEHGKPYFADKNAPHFNISHSRDKAVIMVDDEPCGVDIEMIKPLRFDVAKRFFTEKEKDWIYNGQTEEEKAERFCKIWTGKESYTKMLGCGLTMKLDSFCVLDEEINSLLKYDIEDGYVICICSGKNRAGGN